MQTVSPPRGAILEAINAAYRQGAGKWTGCDWPTDFGAAHLDLAQLTATQALLMARATAGQESADWQGASQWLSRVEQDALEAETAAGMAWALAANGHYHEALFHAHKAWTIEKRNNKDPVWAPLCRALELALTGIAEPEA
jgi:hypothetical protein